MAYPHRSGLVAANSPTGYYELGHNSRVLLVRGGFSAPDADLVAYMEAVAATPNPMNPATSVRRKQATFGAVYDFGQQVCARALALHGFRERAVIGGGVPQVHSDQRTPKQWPRAVQMALEQTRQMAKTIGVDAGMYNVVHANYYPDGRAGIGAHADDERQMVAGAPIFSYSLCSLPRRFRISRNGQRVTDIVLHHGDVLVMMGEMQKHFKHSVPPTTAKAYANAYRLNLTVRAFK